MEALLILLSAVLGLFVFLKFIEAIRRKAKSVYRQYEMIKKVPGPPKESIILGNLKEFHFTVQEDIPNYMKKVLDRYAGLAAQWLSCFSLVFIGRAEYAQHLFTSADTSAKSDVIRFLRPVLGQRGLIILDGEVWKQHRRLITPTFHFSILTTYCDIFADNSNRLIQNLRAYPPDTAVDVMELMHLHALDNICEAAMGVKSDALHHPAHEYTKALKMSGLSFSERVQRPWYWNDFLFFKFFNYGRKCNEAAKTISDFIEHIVKLKRKQRTQKQAEDGNPPVRDEYGTGKKRLAFLDQLLETAETQSVPFSDVDLLDQVKTFMGAGLETTGTSLGFILHLLGTHPAIQEKCHKELDRIFEGSDRKPTVTDLQNMKYLDQVIKESLRLFPPVPILGRQVTRDLQLEAYTIPAGSDLFLDIFYLHRDPRYFPDPEKFDPERFTPENSAKRHPYAYVPFSAGSRNCIGQRFAMMQMKTTLSYILRNFTLESVYREQSVQVMYTVFLHSVQNLDVKFRPRHNESTNI